MHLFGPLLCQQISGFAKRAGRVANIVHNNANLVFNLADYGHARNLAGGVAAFVHNRKVSPDILGELARTGHTANIGGNYGHVFKIFEMVLHVQRKNR